MVQVLKVGDLAYFDSFAGMVPIKVLTISREGVDAKVTAARKPYKRGEIITTIAHRIAPRKSVRFRKYGTRIMPFTWIAG